MKRCTAVPSRDLAKRAAEEPSFARGEIVLVVAGAPPRQRARTRRLTRCARSSAQSVVGRIAVEASGAARCEIVEARDNEAYKRALQLKGDRGG